MTAQYCRYCAYFVTGNGNYCEIKNTNPTDKQAKRANKCKDFLLNEIDAFCENLNGYHPRARHEVLHKVEEIVLYKEC